MNILLIEDDINDIEYIREILSLHNVTVRNRPSEVESIDGYELIIIDYFFGSESALDFLNSLNKKHDFKTPILLTSGKVDLIPLSEIPSELNVMILSKVERFKDLLNYYLNLFQTDDSPQSERSIDYKTLFMDLVHDLRNDLGYALNFEQIKEMGLDDPEKEKEFLYIIKNSALFCYHRLEELSQYLNTENEVFGLAQDAFDSISNTKLIKDFRDSIVILGNQVSINKVPTFFVSVILKNLIENSCKSRDTNKPLKIQVSFVENDNQLNIIISDNGVGMPQEKASSLFHKKMDSSDGLGVGLVVLSRIIKSFSGKIIIASAVGKGTTISINFPN